MTGALPDPTISEMVACIDDAWTLREATPAERGFSPVYRLVIDTSSGTRECYLKAAPEADDPGVRTDARLSALLREETAIPVPEVLGVVDEHGTLPAPFYLSAAMPGEDVGYAELGWLPDRTLETVAHRVGAALGELHDIDAVDSYGLVTAGDAPTLAGGRPSGTTADLSVSEGVDNWRRYLERGLDHNLEQLADSRFEALTGALGPWCRARIASLPDDFEPVLGRNDHGLHNLLLDREGGDVTAMLDWAYTLAVTPAFDFEFAAYLFGGKFLTPIRGVPDRQGLVRDALLAGYESVAPERVGRVAERRPLYELLAMLRVMTDFDQLAPRLPDGTEASVADGLRADARAVMADGDSE